LTDDEQHALRIEKVLAPNPGPYTGPGTNTYVVGDGASCVVIDPGPVIDSHRVAIEHAIAGATPVAVLVTHTHPDHAPAANPLARRLGVPAIGYDRGDEFEPDERMGDGDELSVGGVTLRAVHTPGHTDDHLCYLADRVLFTGDHIMGGSTVVIEDAAAYMSSLEKVRALSPGHICPGHGDEIPDAVGMVDAYIAHRREREVQIVEAVGAGASSPRDIVDVVYAGLDPALVPAAQHQVMAQLEKLISEGRVALSAGDASRAVVVIPPEVTP
jgi:glyoxylase-like metal-dependent hydrolase (beta-lactamase superfamily II)